MSMEPPKLMVDARSVLGEGPSWDERSNVLYWVDIAGECLHIYNPSTNENAVVNIGQPIGAVAPCKSGGIVMALQHGFYSYDFDKRMMSFIVDPEADLPYNRFNDGKCDAKGRFWAGTMRVNKDVPNQGSLYCLDTDFTVRRVLSNLTISNGLGWSPDNQTMYYIDSATRKIMAYDFDLLSAELSNPRVAVDATGGIGGPDGMTVDEEGMIWAAIWDGYCVKRFNPDTGETLEIVSVPAARVTSCVFGGSGLSDLYITTARFGLSEQMLLEQPHAGGLFVQPTKVKGLPTYSFGE
ncbi:SMP-30/gluconolactonase/LRE family protein [Paenibacillus filicis]|uniref:SMP-30/gluconolactonase/LRE family protein n=1 Tax=Paenibacillus gyeongsangnamensis TaxID=3388067 RepID=A0ABT4QKC3_9BACL|nr:SMP-30/gluconolactonase/LRE family protein [Paenibacillus filicis]MCZ8517329.1 SMP-30/gluconolactonase/LRE family protein [Paenibacillus filicis]